MYPPATCQELAIPFAMSAIHVRCEEARQPHRPAVMHAGSRVRRNKVRATVMGAGVAQCSRGVDYRPAHLGGSRHEAYQKLRHSYEAYETIWRRPPAALAQQGEPALYKI